VKLPIKIVLPVAVLFVAATAVALAAPITPTTPYPAVPANADVCLVEKLEIQRQQAEFDTAMREYDRIRSLYPRSASASELRAAERAVHLAGIRLNNAKYAEAACRNNLGNDANKACIALALELNRLIDEAPADRAAHHRPARPDRGRSRLPRLPGRPPGADPHHDPDLHNGSGHPDRDEHAVMD
jgi:hypothetical protein